MALPKVLNSARRGVTNFVRGNHPAVVAAAAALVVMLVVTVYKHFFGRRGWREGLKNKKAGGTPKPGSGWADCLSRQKFWDPERWNDKTDSWGKCMTTPNCKNGNVVFNGTCVSPKVAEGLKAIDAGLEDGHAMCPRYQRLNRKSGKCECDVKAGVRWNGKTCECDESRGWAWEPATGNCTKDVVTVYDHTSAQPKRYAVGSYHHLSQDGWEDRIRSIVVPKGLRAYLYEHGDYKGKKLMLNEGAHELNNFKFGDDTTNTGTNQCNPRGCWGAIASSLRVTRV